MTMDPLRILIVDDHPLVRSGIRTFLNSVDGIEIAGEAANGEEAVKQALALQPDLILMDLQMPGAGNELRLNGIEATHAILHTSPHIGVIVLTVFEDDDAVFAAMRAGARGYILKGADQAELLRAIQAVSLGEAMFSPGIARRLVSYFSTLSAIKPSQAFPELTDRERQILDLIAHGLNNFQIAERLSLSAKTVRNHISNIFSKLQVADRAQAILRAREAGMGQTNT
jgi:DNA-binding NarL/FixJ family response regulator